MGRGFAGRPAACAVHPHSNGGSAESVGLGSFVLAPEGGMAPLLPP
jgi:hypothetical protein